MPIASFSRRRIPYALLVLLLVGIDQFARMCPAILVYDAADLRCVP
jgi:hypothetical protein